MRLASRKFNRHSRNPDVLPIFLHVIPKRHRRHPQFFPNASRSRSRPVALAIGIAACLAAVAIAVAGVIGLDARIAGARAASEDGVSPVPCRSRPSPA